MKQKKLLRQLPESFTLPYRVEENINSTKINKPFSSALPSSPQPNMTEQEHKKLKVLKQRLQRNKVKAVTSPYSSVNHQLNQIIHHRYKNETRSKISSKVASKLLSISRTEAMQATIIQKAVKRYLCLRKMTYLLHLYRMSRKIQAFVRGFLRRDWYRWWSRLRLSLILQCQSLYRGYKARKAWKLQFAKEYIASSTIQCFIRNHLAKLTLSLRKQNVWATIIQCAWRSFTSKYQLAERVLTMKASFIQKCYRGFSMRIFYQRFRTTKVNATICVQRCWRGYVIRCEQERLLYTRMIQDRLNHISLLTCEEKIWSEIVEDIECSSVIDRIQNEIEDLKIVTRDTYTLIQEHESNLLELQIEKASLSPRAVGEGWDIELDKRMADTRKLVTKCKCEVLFHSGLKLRQLNEKLTTHIKELEQGELMKSQIKQWREDEINKLWKRQQSHDDVKRHRERSMRIADERRKWDVKLYMKSEKSDKLRKRENQENLRFCATPLGDFVSDSNNFKEISQSLAQCNIQNWQSQVLLFQELLWPVTEAKLKAEKLCTNFEEEENIASGTQTNVCAKSVSEVIDTHKTHEEPCETNNNLQSRVCPTANVPWGLLKTLDEEKLKLHRSMNEDRVLKKLSQ